MRSRAVVLPLIAVLIGSMARAESFVMPYGGNVYLEATGAKPGAEWKFGIGTASLSCHVYLSSLPDTSYPRGEIAADNLKAGDTIRFCMWSKYGATTAWAFSDSTDPASRVAFGDASNALHLGGNVIEKTSESTWLMHLDNAVSYLYDDSNDDILIKIRIEPSGAAPASPSSAAAPASAPSSATNQSTPNKKAAKSWQQATVTDISEESVYVGSSSGPGNLPGNTTAQYRPIWTFTIDAGRAVYVVRGDCGKVFTAPCRSLAVNGPVQIAAGVRATSILDRIVESHGELIYIKDSSGKEYRMYVAKKILKP